MLILIIETTFNGYLINESLMLIKSVHLSLPYYLINYWTFYLATNRCLLDVYYLHVFRLSVNFRLITISQAYWYTIQPQNIYINAKIALWFAAWSFIMLYQHLVYILLVVDEVHGLLLLLSSILTLSRFKFNTTGALIIWFRYSKDGI